MDKLVVLRVGNTTQNGKKIHSNSSVRIITCFFSMNVLLPSNRNSEQGDHNIQVHLYLRAQKFHNIKQHAYISEHHSFDTCVFYACSMSDDF